MTRKDVNGNTINSKYDCMEYQRYNQNVILTEDGFVILVVESQQIEDKTMEYLLSRSKKEDYIAQYCYGYMLQTKQYAQFDESLFWLKKSYDNGFLVAAQKIAMLGLAGIYSEANTDINSTMKYLREAAIEELPSSCFLLYLLSQHLFEFSKEEKMKLLYTAAESNHPKAQLELAKKFFEGDGLVPQDWIEARNWYQRSAKNGNLQAISWCLDNNVETYHIENGIIRTIKQQYKG